jgi:hypothetical protein
MWLGNGYIIPMTPKPLSSGGPPPVVGDFIELEPNLDLVELENSTDLVELE